jgi:hypothetical protein
MGSAAKSDPRLQVPSEPGAEIHPYTTAHYSRADDGLVRVVHRGREGLFTWDGKWVSGELRHADLHMCLWVSGGVKVPRSYRVHGEN